MQVQASTVVQLFLMAFTLLALPAAGAQPGAVQVAAVIGLGVDWETAEYSPGRCMLGLSLSDQAAAATLVADCGIPWEPSVRIVVDRAVLDLGLLRLGVDARGWVRACADVAAEMGVAVGARAEIGPRLLALSAAGAISARHTQFEAIDGPLDDIVPLARLGVAWRPIEPARFELAIASDSPLALWLRTSFELSGSWTLASGIRIEGLLAARYSDFFTLTGYLDGFDARAAVFLPIAGGGR